MHIIGYHKYIKYVYIFIICITTVVVSIYKQNYHKNNYFLKLDFL